MKENSMCSKKEIAKDIAFCGVIAIFIIAVVTFIVFVAVEISAKEEAIAAANSGIVIEKVDGEGNKLNYLYVEVPYTHFWGEEDYALKKLAVNEEALSNSVVGVYYNGEGNLSDEDARERYDYFRSFI